MGTFHRTNITPEGFIRGAARLLVAPVDTPIAGEISDILTLASGAAQYNAASAWVDLGATKTGINVARNNAEEEFDVDQILTAIETLPTGWEMSVGTALAEVTTENIAYAWEATQPTLNTSTSSGVDEKVLGLGAPDSYEQRQLAVIFKRPKTLGDSSQLLRAFLFRRVQRTPQDSSVTFQKTGEQQTLAIRWKALADSEAPTVDEQFGYVFDQVN